MYDPIKNVAMRDVRSNQDVVMRDVRSNKNVAMRDVRSNQEWNVAWGVGWLTDCLIKVKHLEKVIHSNRGCSIKVNVKVT